MDTPRPRQELVSAFHAQLAREAERARSGDATRRKVRVDDPPHIDDPPRIDDAPQGYESLDCDCDECAQPPVTSHHDYLPPVDAHYPQPEGPLTVGDARARSQFPQSSPARRAKPQRPAPSSQHRDAFWLGALVLGGTLLWIVAGRKLLDWLLQ